MRIFEIDPSFSYLDEYASSGATAAGNIASINGGLWAGPTKGEYPYVTPDYAAAGLEQVPLRLGQAGAIPRKKRSRKKRKEAIHRR